ARPRALRRLAGARCGQEFLPRRCLERRRGEGANRDRRPRGRAAWARRGGDRARPGRGRARADLRRARRSSRRLGRRDRGPCRGPVHGLFARTTFARRASRRAELPLLAPPKGKARLWLAESAQGRVGLIAGAGMAVSRDATLALAGDAPPRLWNASGAGPLRLGLRAIDVDVAPPAQGGALFRAVIPPLTAQPVTLAMGEASLALELPEEVAAFAAPGETSDFAIYG